MSKESLLRDVQAEMAKIRDGRDEGLPVGAKGAKKKQN